MSRVYFHSPSGEAELLGSERAYAGVLVNRLALACLQPDSYKMNERLLPAIPASSYLHNNTDSAHWTKWFETWWSVNMQGDTIRVDEHDVSPWHLSLNTALVIGSDATELLARVHATCEIHGYVEGEHRAWLAGIIDQGREDKVLRANMGWESVAELLRATNSEPVVMSYSVCDGFPNAYLAHSAGTWTPVSADDDDLWDEWAKLAKADQWRLCMDAVRQVPVELNPEVWKTRGFGLGLTVFDLLDSLDRHERPVASTP